MNRGLMHALVAFGVILLILFVFDRADLMRLFSNVREFVIAHRGAVVIGLIALLSLRVVMHSPHQIGRP